MQPVPCAISDLIAQITINVVLALLARKAHALPIQAVADVLLETERVLLELVVLMEIAW
jgi:hypothetical protein